MLPTKFTTSHKVTKLRKSYHASRKLTQTKICIPCAPWMDKLCLSYMDVCLCTMRQCRYACCLTQSVQCCRNNVDQDAFLEFDDEYIDRKLTVGMITRLILEILITPPHLINVHGCLLFSEKFPGRTLLLDGGRSY